MADRYWVGGGGGNTWDGTAGTKWATTSGGAGGASVPTTADDVFFDANSPDVIISTGNTGARSLNCSGYTNTMSGSASLTIAGSLLLSSAMTMSYVGQITFTGSGSITTNGKTLGSDVVINSPGNTISLLDNFTIGAANLFTLTAGTFSLGIYSVSCGAFWSSNSNTRSIQFHPSVSATIQLIATAASVIVLNIANATNFTIANPANGKFVLNMLGFLRTINSGNVALPSSPETNCPNLQIIGSGGQLAFAQQSAFRDLDASTFGGSFGTTLISINVYRDFNSQTAFIGSLSLNCKGTGSISTGLTPNTTAPGTINILAAGKTVTLATNCVSNSVNLIEGTLSLAGLNLSALTFNTNYTTARTLNYGSGGSITVRGTSFSASTSTNLTVTGTGVNRFTASGTSTFNGSAGFNWGTLSVDTANAELVIVGDNTIGTLQSTAAPVTITFTAGSTQTITNWLVNGYSPSLAATIRSTSAGSQATISKSSGTAIATYLSVKDSNATGGATWVATNSINDGNNTGWTFPASGGAFMQFF